MFLAAPSPACPSPHSGTSRQRASPESRVPARVATALTRLARFARGVLSRGEGDGCRFARPLRQQPQPQILRDVGVLIFVDQNEFEARLILAQHFGMLAEQPDAFEQQIAEIGGVENLQPLLKRLVEFQPLAVGEHGGFARRHLLGREPAVLPAVDQHRQHARRPALLVDVLGFQKLLEQPDLVVDVENGEVGFQPDQLGVAAQNLHADRMEGAEPRHALDHVADDVADAVLHLARRLVGEGDGEDFARPGAADGEDVGDAHGEHAGLAGAGAGQHQHRAVERLDRQPLLGIEPGEIRRRRRRGARARAQCRPARGPAVRSARRCASEGQPLRLGPLILMLKKMAPAGGFYEACVIPCRQREFTGRGWIRRASRRRNDAVRHFIYLSTTTLASWRSFLRKTAKSPVEPATGSR